VGFLCAVGRQVGSGEAAGWSAAGWSAAGWSAAGWSAAGWSAAGRCLVFGAPIVPIKNFYLTTSRLHGSIK